MVFSRVNGGGSMKMQICGAARCGGTSAAMEFAQICSSEYGGYRGRIGCCRDEKWNYNRCVKKRTRSA